MKLKTFNKQYSKLAGGECHNQIFSWYDVKELLNEQEQNWQKICDKLRRGKNDYKLH